MPPTSSTATSCASTSTPVRARRTRWPRRPPRATKQLLDELGVHRLHQDVGQPRAARLRAPAPTHDSVAVRSAAVAVARELERRHPDLITASWWKEERGERIFIDFNQNAPHKTVFAPWSVRALDHAPVSFPFPWEMLPTLRPHDMTIATVPAWVAAARRRVGDDGRRAAVARAVPGDGPRRSGRRPARCAVAARVPEDGGRAVASCTQPGQEAQARKPGEAEEKPVMTALPIADRWFERTTIDDSITLLWEPHVIPLMRCNIWHVRGRDRDLIVDTGMGLMSLSDELADLARQERHRGRHARPRRPHRRAPRVRRRAWCIPSRRRCC